MGERLSQPTRRGQPRVGAMMAGALLLVAAAPAQRPGGADGVFDTTTAPRFGDPLVPLRAYLREVRPVPRGAQHFCVVGYGRGRDAYAWVHWREGRRLIRWTGTDPDFPEDALRWAKEIDFATGVVATEADVGSSTYLVSRAFVAGILTDCAAGGTRYVVHPPLR